MFSGFDNSRIFLVTGALLCLFSCGCVLKRTEPVNLRPSPECEYEVERPENSAQHRAEEDFRRYQEAAALGNASATHKVGVCYLDGYGVHRDEAKGFEILRLAASMNDTESKYRVGLCLADGIGTAQDEAEATQWMLAAAREKHPGAQKWLARRGVYTDDPLPDDPWRHHRHVSHPHFGHHAPRPDVFCRDECISYQGKTAAGNGIGVGLHVHEHFDPGMIRDKKEHDKRREAMAKPEIERLKREKAEKEKAKKDEEERRKREEIKAKNSK